MSVLEFSFSESGFKNLLKILLGETKTKFGMVERVTADESERAKSFFPIWKYSLGGLEVSASSAVVKEAYVFSVEIKSVEDKTDAPALYLANRLSQFPIARFTLGLYNPERAAIAGPKQSEPQRASENEKITEKTVEENNLESEITSTLKEIKEKTADLTEIRDAIRRARSEATK